MKHTKKGYEIAVVGESIETARYAGMNISRIIITAMIVSGGLCGITGMIQASAVEKTLGVRYRQQLRFYSHNTGMAFQAQRCLGFIICIAFAVLLQGGDYIQIALGVSSSVADIVQGLILFFILGSEFFMRYKVHIGRNKEEVA